MMDNRGERETELRAEFSDQGGHVLWTKDESPEPLSVKALAEAFVPDIIRWALEHKGVHIDEGDVIVSSKAIDHWKKPFKRRIDMPKTYFGYAGWKP